MLLFSVVFVALALPGALFRDSRDSVLLDLLTRYLEEYLPWEVTLNAAYLKRYNQPVNNKVEFKNNEIADIASNTFRQATGVTEIDLSDNAIRDIEVDAFKGLVKLTHLYLAKNQLPSLHSKMFVGLESLSVLDLSDNAISDIEENTFVDLNNLRTLYLFNNQLTGLKEGMFRGLWNLKYFQIYNNKISSIENWSFRLLAEVQRLDLSFNKLRSLTEDTFYGLEGLTHLNLKENRIKSMKNVLKEMPLLEELDLAKNRLVKLNETTFQGATSLDTIYLEKNQIATIERGIYEGLPRPITMSLSGNPFNCDDGSLCWLKHEIEAGVTQVTGTGSLTCSDGSSWYTRDWVCENDCGDPPEVTFARAQWEGVKVSYECEPCYEGGGTIECGENGRWSAAPTCTRGQCPWEK